MAPTRGARDGGGARRRPVLATARVRTVYNAPVDAIKMADCSRLPDVSDRNVSTTRAASRQRSLSGVLFCMMDQSTRWSPTAADSRCWTRADKSAAMKCRDEHRRDRPVRTLHVLFGTYL